MARYFAGTRTALWGRNSSLVVWDTTLGSPARYNSSFVAGAISAPAPIATTGPSFGVQLDLGLDATTATNLFLTFDMLPSFGSSGSYTMPWIQYTDSSGVNIARVTNNGTGSATVNFQRWTGSAWTTVGTFNGPNNLALSSWQFQIITGAPGTFRAWQDGVLIAEYTSIPFSITTPVRRVGVFNHLNGTSYISRILMSDFDMRYINAYMLTLPNVGAFNDGTGTIADMADGNLNSFKNFTANGQQYTADNANITIPAGFEITNVTMAGIMRGAAPVANARTIMEISGTVYNLGNNVPALTAGYEWRGQDWPTYPLGGNWTANNFNATNKGHQART